MKQEEKTKENKAMKQENISFTPYPKRGSLGIIKIVLKNKKSFLLPSEYLPSHKTLKNFSRFCILGHFFYPKCPIPSNSQGKNLQKTLEVLISDKKNDPFNDTWGIIKILLKNPKPSLLPIH